MSNLWTVKLHLCRKLRTKAMFIDADPDPDVPDTADGMFWCTHTRNCLGPDGQVASEMECQEGRACFERK